jgi:glyoxylase-like metal-dependent hydrolase (beta-lactamase superfamily II)
MQPLVSPTRREFLKMGSACAAHLALMARPFPLAARKLWSGQERGRVVAREPFGRLEEVGEGLWALISTPLEGDYTTVANGGIVAGREGVLAVEGFQTPQGARWLAERARELTGRWPTHVLVTHYHSDHSRGVEGYFCTAEGAQARGEGESHDGATPQEGGIRPSLHATEVTRSLTLRSLPSDSPATLRRQWADVALLPGEEPSTIDLGGRIVKVSPRRGHTASDVTVELPDESVLWCGDIVWNGMFPNYMDAVPSQLSRAVRSIRSGAWATLVPGHGPVADSPDLDRYAAVLEGVEETARQARREGWTAEEAARRHEIPFGLGEWTLFNPSFIQRAMEAWFMEWQGAGGTVR